MDCFFVLVFFFWFGSIVVLRSGRWCFVAIKRFFFGDILVRCFYFDVNYIFDLVLE